MQFYDLFGVAGYTIELRAIRYRGGVSGRHHAKTSEEIEEFALRYGRNAEIYFKVASSPIPRCLWVDIDFKDTPETAARTELALFDLMPSAVVHSGGGLHVYWRVDGLSNAEQARPMLWWLAHRLGGDLRSAEPAHILRWPGTMNHKYSPPRPVVLEEIRDVSYEPWEFGVDDTTRRRSGKEIYSGPTAGDAALRRAEAWVEDITPAIQGSGGDDHTFKVACMLIRDIGISEDDALRLMLRWNETCIPPWTETELKKKIHGAALYGTGVVGSEDPEADFIEVAEDILDDGMSLDLGVVKSKMDRLTEKYRATIDGGRLRVYYMEDDHVMGRSYWQSSTKQDFIDIVECIEHMGPTRCGKTKGDEPRYESTGVHWLKCHHDKETYRGLVFMPECPDEKTSDGRLNIWRGFAPVATGRPGSWSMLKRLVLESLCGGDKVSYEYVMNWMASATQRPHIPAGTALVFKGPKGTGKSTLGRYFCEIFGRHGMQVTSPTLLTGRFNAHLRDVVALFADEAFWAGDKSGEGILKGIVTEKFITYEGKGSNAESGRNCIHLIMASNEEWVIPAGIDQERRFAVFNVGEDIRTRQFWQSLNDEMRGGGLAAMLLELRMRDIADFDSTIIPKTEALAEQKFFTLTPSEQWLVDLVVSDYDGLELWNGNTVLASELERSIEDFFRHKHLRTSFAQIRTHLGMLLSKMLPGARRIRVLQDGGGRPYGYILPHPKLARLKIEEKFGLDLKKFLSVEMVEQDEPRWDTDEDEIF